MKLSRNDKIDKILERIRKYIGISEIEKKNFGEVFTSFQLINEMLDTLPTEVWNNHLLKWGDFCNGVGNFPVVVIQRLMNGLKSWEQDEEKRYKHIVENMIYVCDLQPKNMFLWMMLVDPKNEYKLNLFTGSFLSKEFDEHMKNIWNIDKVDVVIGNPPYNSGLYKKFTDKSITLTNDLVFVIPSTFTVGISHKKFIDNLKTNGIKTVNFLSREYFDVDIDTLYFHLNKKYSGKITINNIIETDEISNFTNNLEFSIFNKIENLEKFELHRGKNKTLNFKNPQETNDIKFNETEGTYRLLSRLNGGRGDEIYWITKPSTDDICNKIVFPRGTGSYNSKGALTNFKKDIVFTKYVDKDTNVSTGLMFIPIENEKQYDIIRWYLMRSVFIRFVFLRKNLFSELTKGLFKYIPKIDLNRTWSDNQLYEYFNLTQDEIKLIEETF